MQRKTKKQKILNQAFYAALILSGLSFLGLILELATLNLIGVFELILFPTLGYLTKKANKKAVIALLILFVFDRIMLLKNWIYITSLPGLIVGLIMSLIFWTYFYKAYWLMNRIEQEKKEND